MVGAKRHSSFLEARRVPAAATTTRCSLVLALSPSWRRQQSIYGPTTKALFCTMNDETKGKEYTIGSNVDDVDADDASRLLLYQQFKDLSLEIRRHDELYYGGTIHHEENNNTSSVSALIISDDEFDALVRREEEIEERYPDLLQTWQLESGQGKAATRSGRVGATTLLDGADDKSSSGTSLSGAQTTTRAKRKHLTPMLSLDNVHTEDELQTWLKRVVKAATIEEKDDEEPSSSMVTIVTEPKLDGVSLSLRYELSATSPSSENDERIQLDLQWASTRGDGTIGQDVTAAAKQISGIPETIHLPIMDGTTRTRKLDAMALEVRGEVVLPRSEFLKIQQAEAVAKEQQQMMERQKEEEEAADDSDVKNNSTTAATNTNPASVVSFSNPRNAASGLLLRKESDDLEEQASSKQLRSLLRFYAYDLSGLLEEGDGGASSELDGIQIRDQLSDWGFPLALPVAITNIEWKSNNNHNDTNSSDSRNETETSSSSLSKALWDDWFQETIAGDQIQPILKYFSALEEHREQLQEENNKNLTMSSKSSITKKSKASQSSTHYDWGDFDVDGCVHKVTQASLRSTMGYTTKSPKWATAHKFPAQSSVARLLDIIIQVGRTGALTPVAILEPTEVGGVTVQRATLHNFGHLQDILGSDHNNHSNGEDESDENNNNNSKAASVVSRIPKYEPVLVQRAGDVIPQVVRRIRSSYSEPFTAAEDSPSKTWISLDPPDKCPFCSSPVSYETITKSSSTASAVGQVVRCSGPPLLCPPRAVTSLKHAFSRDAMDLTGLSEARIQQLMDADLLKYPSDIFTMGDAQWKSLEALPGWGERSCQNLRDSSETVASRGITLGRFVYSLGIRHVGKHTSELVASCYGSVGAFLEALGSASKHQLVEQPEVVAPPESEGRLEEGNDTESLLPPPADDYSNNNHPFPELENKLGIGPVAIDSLLAFSKTKELTDAAKALAESLTISEQDVVLVEDEEEENLDGTTASSNNTSSNRPWKGFRVVFTGSLGVVDGLTRSRAQEIAKQLGAKATPGSVSKNTDLVVFGEKGGKKLTQARELGIPTMEAEEFVKLATEIGLLDISR